MCCTVHVASPSFGSRLQVAKGWASRRQSVETGHLLSTHDLTNIRRSSDAKKGSFIMEGQNVDDLIKLLETSVDIFEQADILHYLFVK